MNGLFYSKEEVKKYSDKVLLDHLVYAASSNNEMDCRAAVNVLFDEVLRRMSK